MPDTDATARRVPFVLVNRMRRGSACPTARDSVGCSVTNSVTNDHTRAAARRAATPVWSGSLTRQQLRPCRQPAVTRSRSPTAGTRRSAVFPQPVGPWRSLAPASLVVQGSARQSPSLRVVAPTDIGPRQWIIDQMPADTVVEVVWLLYDEIVVVLVERDDHSVEKAPTPKDALERHLQLL